MEQSVEEGEATTLQISGKARTKNQCKGPDVGVCPAGLGNIKETTVAAVEWTRWKVVRDEVTEETGVRESRVSQGIKKQTGGQATRSLCEEATGSFGPR